VREFLQFFNLEYTLAVFDPEVGCVSMIFVVYYLNRLFHNGVK